MRKRKQIVYVLGILGTVLILNLLSWLSMGRERALLLAAREFDSAGAVTSDDTLYVFTGHVAASRRGSQFPDFKAGVRDAFVRHLLSSSGVSQVKVHPGSFKISHTEPIVYNNHDAAFFVVVDRSMPLWSVIETTVYAPEFVIQHEIRGFWFFRWWELSRRLSGIS